MIEPPSTAIRSATSSPSSSSKRPTSRKCSPPLRPFAAPPPCLASTPPHSAGASSGNSTRITMKSLRNRLWLGFGSLLSILLAVSALSMIVFTRYSHALERVFRENYDSAIFCDAMKESLDQLNTRAQQMLWKGPVAQSTDFAGPEARFESNLNSQLNNCTLPGEV